MKTIKTTHIDTGGHGYLSVSKKDFLLVCGIHEITHYSGHTYNRIYLEEDQDASTFMDKAKSLDIKVDVKSGYNLKFKITHNYRPELFNYVPKAGDVITLPDETDYTIDFIKDNGDLIVSNATQRYRIPASNPFEYIKGFKTRNVQ